jgi:hypothetical protein
LTTATTAPDTTSPDLPTRSTFRMLVMRGLAPDEAANLTAFISGIHVGAQTWDLREVNKLLFLRDLHRSGRIGDMDGGAPAG